MYNTIVLMSINSKLNNKDKKEVIIEEILSKKLDDIIINCYEYEKYNIPTTAMKEPIDNSYPYVIPPLIVKTLGKRLMKAELSNPFLVIETLKKDMEILEKFIKDQEYRKHFNQIKTIGAIPIYDKTSGRLIGYDDTNIHFKDFEYIKYCCPDLMNLKRLILKRIGLPLNTSFRYEKVKCSKICCTNDCKHEPHYYLFAYWWDSTKKKLKKKYLGKNLPLPCKISISN
jgi:hypothetical protein